MRPYDADQYTVPTFDLNFVRLNALDRNMGENHLRKRLRRKPAALSASPNPQSFSWVSGSRNASFRSLKPTPAESPGAACAEDSPVPPSASPRDALGIPFAKWPRGGCSESTVRLNLRRELSMARHLVAHGAPRGPFGVDTWSAPPHISPSPGPPWAEQLAALAQQAAALLADRPAAPDPKKGPETRRPPHPALQQPEGQRPSMSRPHRERLRALHLLTPPPEALAALDHRVTQHLRLARDQRRQQRNWVRENIRRAQEHRRPSGWPPDVPASNKEFFEEPSGTHRPSVPQGDALLAASWRALLLVVRFPAALALAHDTRATRRMGTGRA